MDCFSIDKSACNISQFAIFQNFHHNLLGFGFKNMRLPQNKPVGGTIIFNGTTISRFSLFNSVFYWKSKLIYYYHKIIFLSLFRFRPSLPHRRKSGVRNLNSLFSNRSLYGQACISACTEMTFYIVCLISISHCCIMGRFSAPNMKRSSENLVFGFQTTFVLPDIGCL